MLYGSSTGSVSPFFAVAGSMRVTLLPTSLRTHSVRRSHEGVTCCGSFPTAKWSTTLKVRGSITSTVSLLLLGT